MGLSASVFEAVLTTQCNLWVLSYSITQIVGQLPINIHCDHYVFMVSLSLHWQSNHCIWEGRPREAMAGPTWRDHGRPNHSMSWRSFRTHPASHGKIRDFIAIWHVASALCSPAHSHSQQQAFAYTIHQPEFPLNNFYMFFHQQPSWTGSYRFHKMRLCPSTPCRHLH